MSDPTPLSLAAHAVLDAYATRAKRDPHGRWVEPAIAAVLRAAADQVVPDDPQEAMYFTTEAIRLNKQGICRQIFAIADELEAQ